MDHGLGPAKHKEITSKSYDIFTDFLPTPCSRYTFFLPTNIFTDVLPTIAFCAGETAARVKRGQKYTFTDASILPQTYTNNFTDGDFAGKIFTGVFLGLGPNGPRAQMGPGPKWARAQMCHPPDPSPAPCLRSLPVRKQNYFIGNHWRSTIDSGNYTET